MTVLQSATRRLQPALPASFGSYVHVEAPPNRGGTSVAKVVGSQAQRLAERRPMLRSWANYIDRLKAGLNPAFGQDSKEPRG